METRNIQVLSFELDRFATIKTPYIDDNIKKYVKNFQHGRRLLPVTVIRTSKLLDVLSCTVYDLATGQPITTDSEKRQTWFILDGTKRMKALMELYEETKNPSYMTIDAIIETIDNIENKNVVKYMADINSTAKPWSSKDYVDCCYKMFPENRIFQMAHMLMNLGASISTVSRFSTAYCSRFSSKSIVQYLNGDETALSSVSYTRALELYRLFLEVGFSVNFINHRYLVDFINDECQLNSLIGFDGAVNMIANVDTATVTKIESLPADNKTTNIYRILSQHYQTCKDNGTTKTYTLDFSSDRFSQNLIDIPILAI